MDRWLVIDRIDRRYSRVGKHGKYGVGGVASRIGMEGGVRDG